MSSCWRSVIFACFFDDGNFRVVFRAHALDRKMRVAAFNLHTLVGRAFDREDVFRHFPDDIAKHPGLKDDAAFFRYIRFDCAFDTDFHIVTGQFQDLVSLNQDPVQDSHGRTSCYCFLNNRDGFHQTISGTDDFHARILLDAVACCTLWFILSLLFLWCVDRVEKSAEGWSQGFSAVDILLTMNAGFEPFLCITFFPFFSTIDPQLIHRVVFHLSTIGVWISVHMFGFGRFSGVVPNKISFVCRQRRQWLSFEIDTVVDLRHRQHRWRFSRRCAF